ncbi:MAG: hypothetical protein Tsb002_33370 [Wenzhouxiangellaceae bacterium]
MSSQDSNHSATAGDANSDRGTTEGHADASQPAGDDLREQLANLREQLLAAEANARNERESALRVQAEFDNQRKRLERDVEKSRRFALEKVMNDLLPVIDSLERSLESAADQPDSDKLCEGVALTLKMLTKVGADHGLKPIEPLQQPFDPDLHQAMSLQPTNEEPPNTVMQVLQKGYQLHDRLIRPALVIVSQEPAENA